MKVVDTFLFSEAYEANVLLTKLHLESPVVDEWVLIESAQTFRGEEKGLQARKLLNQDVRFHPFLERIKLIEHKKVPFSGAAGYHTFYEAEERSRASCWDYVRSKYSDDDWLIVSDVDEAVDGTDIKRATNFLGILDGCPGKTIVFGHYRYWYDFDNRSQWSITTPAVQVGSIQKGQASFRCRSCLQWPSVDMPAGDNPLFFEYTFCFSREGMWRKLNSFIHDGYSEADLDRALLVNAWVKAPPRGEFIGQRGHEDWFETVELTEQNSPKFVRDNLCHLKTNAVDKDYKEHRRRLYGK